MKKIGITVIAFKNTAGIKRLLNSLDKVDYCGDEISLIISIDYSGDESVKLIAENYEWKYGNKTIIAHTQNLGLKKHILSCGDLIEQNNFDAMIVLEDDLFVSPEMYKYAKGAVDYYGDNPQIAGISLYKHEFNINAKHPFSELIDGGDTYFVQYAQSWGQIWLKNQWKAFKEWYTKEKWKTIDERRVPQNVLKWTNSWLKFHIMYCIDQNMYFVYPRNGLSTDFSAPGTHTKYTNTSMQIPLCYHKRDGWVFSDFEKSKSVYDAFFENCRIADYLQIDNLEMDTYGLKNYLDSTKYVITTKNLPYKIVKSWGLYLRPVEANILQDISGENIFLYDISVSDINKSRVDSDVTITEYDLKGINILNKGSFKYGIQKIKRAINGKTRRIIKKKKR